MKSGLDVFDFKECETDLAAAKYSRKFDPSNPADKFLFLQKGNFIYVFICQSLHACVFVAFVKAITFNLGVLFFPHELKFRMLKCMLI